MSNERYFTVTRDPHRQLPVGMQLTAARLRQLAEDPQHDGLEVQAENGYAFRLYRYELYRIEADGQMRLWRMPGA